MHTDTRIAALAAEQDGVVARRQLIEMGLGRARIEERLRSGHLIRLYRGTYAVGHDDVTHRGRWRAAAWSRGRRAVVESRTASMVWGIRPATNALPRIAIPGRGSCRPAKGMHCRRAPDLRENDCTTHRGLPVVTASRALLDEAASIGARDLERLVVRAETGRVLDRRELESTLLDHSRHPGCSRLVAVVGAPALLDLRSDLEAAFREICDRTDLDDEPLHNVMVGERLVDAYFPKAGVVVEIDHIHTHGTRSAFQKDRQSDVDRLLGGLVTVRFTDRDVLGSPGRTGERLAAIVARGVATRQKVPSMQV